MKNLLWLSFLFLFFISCKEKPPIDENKFMLIYIDLISFPDSLHNQPEQLEKFKEEVFRKHNTNKKEYEKMIDYYNANPELWEEFFNNAIKYVESRPDSLFIQ